MAVLDVATAVLDAAARAHGDGVPRAALLVGAKVLEGGEEEVVPGVEVQGGGSRS